MNHWDVVNPLFCCYCRVGILTWIKLYVLFVFCSSRKVTQITVFYISLDRITHLCPDINDGLIKTTDE